MFAYFRYRLLKFCAYIVETEVRARANVSYINEDDVNIVIVYMRDLQK